MVTLVSCFSSSRTRENTMFILGNDPLVKKRGTGSPFQPANPPRITRSPCGPTVGRAGLQAHKQTKN